MYEYLKLGKLEDLIYHPNSNTNNNEGILVLLPEITSLTCCHDIMITVHLP